MTIERDRPRGDATRHPDVPNTIGISPDASAHGGVGFAALDSTLLTPAGVDPKHVSHVNLVLYARILMIRSGACCRVLVIETADGATHAIGVGYPGISSTATSVAWESAP